MSRLQRSVLFAEQCLVAFAAGALWSTSLITAPALFEFAPSSTIAGDLAAHIFERVNQSVIVICAALLVFGLTLRPVWKARAVIAAVSVIMLLILLQYGITGWMSAAREAGASRATFMRLHALAAVVYFGASLAGLVLLATRRRGAAES